MRHRSSHEITSERGKSLQQEEPSRNTAVLSVMTLLVMLATATSLECVASFFTTIKYNPQNILLKEPHQGNLTYCQSGNEYLSLTEGGAWIDTGVIKEGYSNAAIQNLHPHMLCYQHEGYKDTYEWQPPCQSRALSLNYSKVSPIKVLLWGDSLTNQIKNSDTFRRSPKPRNPIQYKMVQHRESYFINSSNLVWETPNSSSCQDAINANPTNHYMHSTSEQELISNVFQNVTFDYVFFNHFAHHGHLTARIAEVYAHHNLTRQNLVMDSLKFYEKEMELVARILREHFPTTKAYYRTSSPHVYEWTPAYQPLSNQLVTERSYADCVGSTAKQNKHLWMCTKTYNAIASAMFSKYGHEILDTAPAMSLRVDAHPCSNKKDNGYKLFSKSRSDCNHFCHPGPPDVMLQAIEAEIFAREAENNEILGLLADSP